MPPFQPGQLDAGLNAALDVLNADLATVTAGGLYRPVPVGKATIPREHAGGPMLNKLAADRLAAARLVHLTPNGATLLPRGAAVQLATLAGWDTAPETPGMVDLCAADAARHAFAAGWSRELIDLRVRPLINIALAPVHGV